MAIRNAKRGDIVFMDEGRGPRCKIISKSISSFGTYYLAKVTHSRGHEYLCTGDKIFRRASTLSRKPDDKW